jgi:hypothetical protein
MNLKLTSIIMIAAISVIYLSCGTTETVVEESSFINPPFEGVDVPVHSFSFNPTVDNEVFTPTGTRIFIPKNAIVDQNGKPITKQAELVFKEYHDMADVIASGIPMTYDSAGVGNFITAGMFTMTANLEGQELAIGKDAFIDVEMASFKDGKEYNFYELDSANKNWSYLGQNDPKPNERKVVQMEQFKDNNLIDFNINYSAHPELKPFSKIKWIYSGNQKKLDPFKNKWVFKERWRDITLETIDASKGDYIIHLKSNRKNFDFKASPYVVGDRGEFLAQLNSNIDNLNNVILEQKKREEAIEMQANILRAFKIRTFGACNWDTAKKNWLAAGNEIFDAQFTMKDHEILFSERIYFVDKTDDLVTNKMGSRWAEFMSAKGHDQAIIAVLDDNRVAVCSAKSYRNARNAGKDSFELKPIKKRISSLADLKELMTTL